MNTLFKLSLALVLLGLTACSSKPPPGSGFLGDPSVYAAMKPSEKIDGVRVVRFKDPSQVVGKAYILPPVKIYLNKDGAARDISPEALNELAVYFRQQVQQQLGSKYPLTNNPGPDTRIIRLAITDADPNIPALNVLPQTLLTGAGLGGATVEMAVEDSTNGQLLAAATAERSGSRLEYTSGFSKWGHTKEVLDEFAKAIRQRIDEIESGKAQS